jgi:transcriptional repressor of dcmA and dcmR
MNRENELLDISAAARLLKVSETSLRRWTNAGTLPCLRVGQRRERRFRRSDLLAFMEGQPSSTDSTVDRSRPRRVPPESAAPVTITQGSHLCGIYSSDLGLITLAVPFLLDGLEEGSVCFLVGTPGLRSEVIKYLKKKRPSIQSDVDARRLILANYHASSERQCGYFCEQIESRVAEGVQSFRVLGDTWHIRSKLDAQEFAEYESGYDRLIAQKYPVVTICTYDARKFSGVELLDALKGHRDTFRYPLENALA